MAPHGLASRPPGETIYIVGAGANRCIYDRHGHSPPLIYDVFKTALKKGLLRPGLSDQSTDSALKFVTRLKGLSTEQMRFHEVNFEEVMDAVIKAFSNARTESDRRESLLTYGGLHKILERTITAFERAGVWSKPMERLGKIIVEERAAVLTFNYDIILEDVIGLAAGGDRRPIAFGEGLAYRKAEQDAFEKGLLTAFPFRDFSIWNWRRELAYGVPFYEVQPTISTHLRTVSGEEFYRVATPNLVDVPLLKMHGSLNWFRYTSQPIARPVVGPSIVDFSRVGKLSLRFAPSVMRYPPESGGLYLSPVMVTPNQFKGEAIKVPPFDEIWKAAAQRLSSAKRLVILGYSFRDQHTIDFIANEVDLTGLEELIVVNPSEDRAREIVETILPGFGATFRSTTEHYVWTHALASEDD
jgi:hypothetical protein